MAHFAPKIPLQGMFWGLVAVTSICLPACAHYRPKPTPSATQAQLDAYLDRVSVVLDKCQNQGAYTMCQRPALVDGLSACVELYRKAGICAADLEECRKAGGIDLGLCRSQKQAAEARASRYKWQRWLFAIGALVVGFGVGFGVGIGR